MKGKLLILLAYLRILNPFRLVNYFLLNTSLLLSRLTGRSICWGNAFAVTFETVNGCNLHCPGCETGSGILTREGGLMDIEHFFLSLNKLPQSVFHINLHFQGEPLLHPKITEFVRLAGMRKHFVSLSTNGTLLKESTAKELIRAGLTHIIISLDGADESTYSDYRKGGNFCVVIKNIKQLSRLKKLTRKSYPVIEVQTVVTEKNENNLAYIQKLAFDSGANIYTVKTAYVPNLHSTPNYFPSNPKNRRYKVQSDGSLISMRKIPRFCYRMRSSCVVLHDLRVVCCCFDKNGLHILGNLLKEKFSEIHHGERHKELSDRLLCGNAPEMCSNCI